MNNTFEDILKRLKEGIDGAESTMEGTWTGDNLQALANELARIYSQDIDTMLEKAFVSTATGEYLTRACSDYGMERNPATHAEVMVTVTGIQGTYNAVQVASDNVIFNVDPFTLPGPDGGTLTVRAVCTESGKVGNVPAGTVDRVLGNSMYITAVTNNRAAEGGYDEETDESLAARTLERIRTPSTSGNIADYRKWALETTGVEKVRVFPLARGAGTVDVVIVGAGNTPAPDVLLEAVADYVGRMRPIGADVRILSAETVNIQVRAKVVAVDGYTARHIAGQFRTALETYVSSLAFNADIVSYMKLVDILFGCDGVADVENYTLNGMTESLVLEERQFPAAAVPEIILV